MTPAGVLISAALAVAPAPPVAGAAASPPAQAAPIAAKPQAPAVPFEPDTKPSTGDDAPAFPLFDGVHGAGVEAAFQVAEAHQGPLDGRWRLRDRNGVPLYDVLIDDPGSGRSPRSTNPDHPDIEGAWRALPGRPGAASGVLDSVSRDGARLTLRFQPADQDGPLTIILHPIPGAAWAGDMIRRDGSRRLVFLDRM